MQTQGLSDLMTHPTIKQKIILFRRRFVLYLSFIGAGFTAFYAGLSTRLPWSVLFWALALGITAIGAFGLSKMRKSIIYAFVPPDALEPLKAALGDKFMITVLIEAWTLHIYDLPQDNVRVLAVTNNAAYEFEDSANDLNNKLVEHVLGLNQRVEDRNHA